MRPVRLREVRDVPGLGEEQLGRVGDADLVTLEDLGGAALHSEEVRHCHRHGAGHLLAARPRAVALPVAETVVRHLNTSWVISCHER